MTLADLVETLRELEEVYGLGDAEVHIGDLPLVTVIDLLDDRGDVYVVLGDVVRVTPREDVVTSNRGR